MSSLSSDQSTLSVVITVYNGEQCSGHGLVSLCCLAFYFVLKFTLLFTM